MTPRDAEPPEISVIVPVYRGSTTIEACLTSVRRAVEGLPHEIIVVESSGDGCGALVRRGCPEARLFESPVHLSAGQARNEGARVAQGRWLFFVDQDCEVPADWVRRLGAHLARTGVGAAGGSVGVGNTGNLSGWAVYFLEFLYHFPSGAQPGPSQNFLIGCNSAWNASVFQKLAFPDQTLGEDVLLSHAVRQAGFTVIYDPQVTVIHQNRYGWGEFRRYCRAMGKAAAHYNRQTRRWWLPWMERWPSLLFAAPLAVLPMIGLRLLRAPAGYLPRFVLLLPACLQGQWLWAGAFRQELLRARPSR
jgi:GT2 family glycosyltransferase